MAPYDYSVQLNNGSNPWANWWTVQNGNKPVDNGNTSYVLKPGERTEGGLQGPSEVTGVGGVYAPWEVGTVQPGNFFEVPNIKNPTWGAEGTRGFAHNPELRDGDVGRRGLWTA